MHLMGGETGRLARWHRLARPFASASRGECGSDLPCRSNDCKWDWRSVPDEVPAVARPNSLRSRSLERDVRCCASAVELLVDMVPRGSPLLIGSHVILHCRSASCWWRCRGSGGGCCGRMRTAEL
jgi:hypothetical protein